MALEQSFSNTDITVPIHFFDAAKGTSLHFSLRLILMSGDENDALFSLFIIDFIFASMTDHKNRFTHIPNRQL